MAAAAAEPTDPQHRIDEVNVIMPAHNEEEHLGRALAAVQRAATALSRHRPAVRTRITVVLDGCTDGSAAIAARYADDDSRIGVVEVSLRSVGASRAAGIAAAGIADTKSGSPEMGPAVVGPGNGVPARAGRSQEPGSARIWLANTDADSRVPEHWLLGHVAFAEAGADAVLGSVEPDPDGMDPELLRRWLERHPFEEDHPHIYGANFGVRASAYLAAGGFPELRSDEDRWLVQRLRGGAFTVLSTDSIRVMTSGRTQARAPHGFGAYLRNLDRYDGAVSLGGGPLADAAPAAWPARGN